MKLTKIPLAFLVITSFFISTGMANHSFTQATLVGDGTPGSCTEASLNQAITAGGDISFNCCPNPVIIPITSQKVLQGSLTIDGGNKIILDGGRKTRIFKIAMSSRITIQNITLQNGLAQSNTYKDDKYGQGGAIASYEWSTFTINNVTFKNNESTADDHSCVGGGAIFIGGFDHAYIYNSTFTGNIAKNGGAINDLTSDLYIINSTFDGNQAMHDAYINRAGQDGCGGGGAVYIDGGSPASQGGSGEIYINHSSFTNNATNNFGGAIFAFLYSNDRMSIDGSDFENNRAVFYSFGDPPDGGNGGAIWLAGDNALQDPGRIFTGKIYISDSTIAKNHADYDAGGVYAWDAPLIIKNVTIDANEAKNTQTNPKYLYYKGIGGGLALGAGSAPLIGSELIHTTITNNTAGYTGGGISTLGGQALSGTTMVNTIIANNKTLRIVQNTTIDNNCNNLLTNIGGSIQFPAKTSIIGDHDCASSIKMANPMLGPLQDNGGPTKTEALLAGSPAINYGLAAYCLPFDQRGYIRPGTCDSGAYAYGGTVFVPSAWEYLPLISR